MCLYSLFLNSCRDNNCASELSEITRTRTTEEIGNSAKQTLPVSAKDYYKRFKKAINAQGNERWKILRELGIDLTDSEFESAWQKAQNDIRFKDLKHLMGLPEFNGEEGALFLKLQDAFRNFIHTFKLGISKSD